MHITLRQLNAFRAVVATGSTAAAAQEVLVTQPAVSRLINSLEDAVGFKIFSRERGRLKLTESGKMLFDEAERILNAVGDFGAIADDIREHKTARVRICGSPTVMTSRVVSTALTDFVEEFPNVRLTIETRTRLEIEQDVAGGQSDLGIILLPSDQAGTHCETVARSRLVAAMPPDHNLVAKGALRLTDIEPYPLIVLGSSSRVRILVDNAFYSAGLKPRIKVESRTSIISRNLAADGLGVGLVDELSCTNADPKELVLRRLEPEIPLVYGLMTRIGAPTTPLIDSLKARIADSFQRHLGDFPNQSIT